MRFFIFIMFMTGSAAMAEVQNFNGLVKEATFQEKRLHRKLLQAIQGTQTAVAYNDRWEHISATAEKDSSSFPVKMVRATDEDQE